MPVPVVRKTARNPPKTLDAAGAQYYAFQMHKIPVGVLGASGYAGRTLCALALAHDQLQLAWAAAGERRGESARIENRMIQFVGIEECAIG